MFDRATECNRRLAFRFLAPLPNNCTVSLRNYESLFKVADTVGKTVVLDLGVINIVETSEVMVRAENSSLDSKAKLVADNDIPIAKLENVLGMTSLLR